MGTSFTGLSRAWNQLAEGFVCAALICSSGLSWAKLPPKIYSFTDERGVIHYSNDPSRDPRYKQVFPTPQPQAKQDFIDIRVSKLQFSMPTGWVAIDREVASALDEWARGNAERLAQVRAIRDTEIAVQARPADREKYASVLVNRSVTSQFFLPGNLRQLGAKDLANYDKDTRRYLEKMMAPHGGKVILWHPSKAVELNGTAALKTRYVRTGTSGPVEVEMLKFGNSHEVYGFTLSWRQSEQAVWLPVMQRIKDSLVVTH